VVLPRCFSHHGTGRAGMQLPASIGYDVAFLSLFIADSTEKQRAFCMIPSQKALLCLPRINTKSLETSP
jgi:hypothetical protein